MITLLINPFFLIFAFALGMSGFLGELNIPPYGVVRYLDFLASGVIITNVFLGAVLGSVSVFLDRELGVLKELFVTPLDRKCYVSGKIIASATKASLIGYICFLLSLIAGVRLVNLWVLIAIIPLIFFIALSLAGFSVALTSFIKSQSTYNTVVNVITTPLFFLSNLYYPPELLPPVLSILVKINPLSHLINPLRTMILLGPTFEAVFQDLIFAAIFTVVMVTIGFIIYQRNISVE